MRSLLRCGAGILANPRAIPLMEWRRLPGRRRRGKPRGWRSIRQRHGSRSATRPCRWASMRSASRGPSSGAEARDRLAAFVAEGLHGDMGWMADTAARRGDPAVLWPAARTVVVARRQLRPGRRSAGGAAAARRGTVSVYAQGRDYHDLVKKRLKALAPLDARRARRRGQGLRRHRAGDGKAAGAGGGAGLAGQAHQPRRRANSARGCSSARSSRPWSSRPTRRRRTIAAPAARCLDVCPTAAFPGALPARCAALHLLPDDRAQGAHPARVPRGDGQPHLWLRRLPRGLPVEQVRAAARATRTCCRARELSAPRLADLAAARRCRVPAGVLRLADQADRARPVRAQRADRDRQQRRSGAAPASPQQRLDDASPLVRAMAVWALARLRPASMSSCAASTRRRKAILTCGRSGSRRPDQPRGGQRLVPLHSARCPGT